MDQAYFVWLGVLAAGGLIGLFLKPRIVGIFVGAVLGLLLAGFLFAAAMGYASAVWIAGVALMAAPLLGAVLFFAAAVSNAVLTALKRRR